jgi:hypothetical protein
MTKLVNPVPLFLDGRGALLDAGYIYIGTSGNDPEILANRLNLFWDKALTLPAPQPLRTLGGAIVNGHDLAFVYFAEADFSIAIKDADSSLVAYVPSAFDLAGGSYQPLDADLTAIAALGDDAIRARIPDFGRRRFGSVQSGARLGSPSSTRRPPLNSARTRLAKS